MSGQEEERGPLRVRATINLPDLDRGQEALVDPSDEWIRDALAEGWLTPTDEPPDGWRR